MPRISRFLPIVLAGCSAFGAPARPPPAVVEVQPRADALPPAAETKLEEAVVLAVDGTLRTHRLGDALFVSYFAEVRPTPVLRVVRVRDDGSLANLASGLPPSTWVRARSGSETISGDASALLGEAAGPTWMAFRPYSTFGAALMYRVEDAAWKAGTIGAEGYVGDITASRSRGHLFKIVNRISNEGSYFRLPRGPGPIEPLEVASPFELADGAIVDAGTQVPEIADVTHAAGRSAEDYWALGGGMLVRVRGEHHEQVPLPDPRCSDLLVESDGAVWLSGGRLAYRWNEPSAEWRSHRIVSGFGAARVVAARPGVVFVLEQDERPPSVLRRIAL